VGNVTSPHGWSYAYERIAAGAARAGRTVADVVLTAWAYCSIADDSAAALAAIRPMAATSLATSRSALATLGLEPPPEYVRLMDEGGGSIEGDGGGRAGGAFRGGRWRWLGWAGPRAECAGSLQQPPNAFPRISQVVIVPAAAAGASIEDVVRRFKQEVVPLISAGAESAALLADS